MLTGNVSTPSKRRRPRGFTLMETALATIIVGVGVLSIVSAYRGFHVQNQWSTHASTAMQLGNEIREMTLNLPRHDPVTGDSFWGPEANELFVGDFDDVDDFDGPSGNGLIFEAPRDGSTPNGPINARREIIENMIGWGQTVRVFSVDPFDITSVETDASTPYVVVEVVVTFQGNGEATADELTTVSWIAPN